MTDDLKALSDGELEQLAQAVEAERRRRLVLALAPVQMDELHEQVASALGREPGAPWVQPTGAHDAYAVGQHGHPRGQALGVGDRLEHDHSGQPGRPTGLAVVA